MFRECTAHVRVVPLLPLHLRQVRLMLVHIRMERRHAMSVWSCVCVEDRYIAREVPVGEVVEEADEVGCL